MLILGPLSILKRTVQERAVDEVLIALLEASRAELVELVGNCDREGTSIKILPDVFQMLAGEIQISTLDTLTLLTMHDLALRGWRRTMKRWIDVIVAGSALVIASPLINSIEERTRHDQYYIENWSILFDLKIMARTLLGSGRDPNAF